LTDAGGKRHPKDECVYVFRDDLGGWLYVSTHVDDIFSLYNDKGRSLRDKVYKYLSEKVTVDDRGILSWALSTKVDVAGGGRQLLA
jgi:hypothetical protein